MNIQALQEQQYQAVQRLSLQDIQRLRQIMFDNQELRMIKCDYNYCEETKEEEEETTAKTNVSKHNVSQNEYCQHNGCKKEYYQHSGCKNKYYQNPKTPKPLNSLYKITCIIKYELEQAT